MQITEFRARRGVVRYDLRNDDNSFVARFDSLGDAARVARYITGADMGDAERQRAIDAMQYADVARTLGCTLNAARQAKRAAKATGGAALGGGDLDAGG